MSPGTFSPSCHTWLPRSLTLSLLLFTLLFSSQFLFFLVKTPCFVLKFLVCLPLVLQDWLQPSHSATVHTGHRLGSQLPPGSLAPCPLHINSHGPISDQCLPSHCFGRLLIPWMPTLALFIGQGLFCLFPGRRQTEDKGRKGSIWSCGPCNAGCTESLMTSSSLKIFVPEDTGVTLTSRPGTKSEVCTYLMSLQNDFLFTGCSGFQVGKGCHPQWAAFVLFLSDWVPGNGLHLGLSRIPAQMGHPGGLTASFMLSAWWPPRWPCLLKALNMQMRSFSWK